MLYSPQQFARDQLVTDLLDVRRRLEAGWVKAWGDEQASCIVAAAQLATGQPVGPFTMPATGINAAQVRLGRALVAVYTALYGPKAPQNITLGAVVAKIIAFNDSRVSTKASVLLLLDRAVAAVHEQAAAGAMVTATA